MQYQKYCRIILPHSGPKSKSSGQKTFPAGKLPASARNFPFTNAARISTIKSNPNNARSGPSGRVLSAAGRCNRRSLSHENFSTVRTSLLRSDGCMAGADRLHTFRQCHAGQLSARLDEKHSGCFVVPGILCRFFGRFLGRIFGRVQRSSRLVGGCHFAAAGGRAARPGIRRPAQL